MTKMCPVAFNQVNERGVQINAALAVFSIIAFLFTPYKWIILVLSIDFFVRGFLDQSFSLYSAISRTLLRIFKIKPVLVNAGPKIFAAKIGFLFCCIIAVSSVLKFHRIGLILCSVFVFFAALEALFRICIACKLYSFIYKSKTSILLQAD